MEQHKVVGRPGIEPQRYHNQIQQWLNEGISIDGITATMLQKVIGGQYKKAVTILDEFKAGYETKELSELPEPPEQLSNALNAASLEIWRLLWNQKNAEVNAACSEFEQEKAGLLNLAAERLELIDALEEQLDQLRLVESTANEKLAKLSDENHEQAQELASLRERLQARDQQVSELKHQLLDSQESVLQVDKQHVSALNEIRSELESKTTKLETTLENLADVRARLESRDLEVKELSRQLDASKQQTDSLNQLLSEQQAKLAESNKSLAVMETKLANAESNATAASRRADKLQSELLSLAKPVQAEEPAEELTLTDEQKQQIKERLENLPERGFTERDVIDAFQRLEKVFLEKMNGRNSFSSVLYAVSTWLQTCEDDAVVISTLSNLRILRRLVDDELKKN